MKDAQESMLSQNITRRFDRGSAILIEIYRTEHVLKEIRHHHDAIMTSSNAIMTSSKIQLLKRNFIIGPFGAPMTN